MHQSCAPARGVSIAGTLCGERTTVSKTRHALQAAREHPRPPARRAGLRPRGRNSSTGRCEGPFRIPPAACCRVPRSRSSRSARTTAAQLTSDAQGRWVLPNLKPGTYRIVVSLDGFKTAALDQVKLDVQGIRDGRGDAGGRRGGRDRDGDRRGGRRRDHEIDAQPDHREQAHGRPAVERPQPVRAGHARAGRHCRPRTTAARRPRSAAAATRRARSRSTASRTSTPRTTSRSST